MRAVIGSMVGAVLLVAIGGVCWTLGKAEREVANVQQQLAVMRYAAAADPADLQPTLAVATAMPLVSTALAADARDARTTGEYWIGRYDALGAQKDEAGRAVARDPQQALFSSNALFRAAQIETVDRPTALSHLEAVIKSYAEALKANPGHPDAAYNYEFAVRTRDTLARARGAAGTSKISVAEVTPTIHGRPGAPPKGVSMSSFKVMVPKQSDERKGGEEAGKGGTKVRKG